MQIWLCAGAARKEVYCKSSSCWHLNDLPLEMNSDQSKIFLTPFPKQIPSARSFPVLLSASSLIGKCFGKQGIRKFFITFTSPTTDRVGCGHWLRGHFCSGSENQREPYVITIEDFSWLSSQGVESVCVIHTLGVHLPSNYVEFHEVLSSLLIHQELFDLRKESQFFQFPLVLEGQNEVVRDTLVNQRHQRKGTITRGWALSDTGDFGREHNLEGGRWCSVSSQTTKSEEGAGIQESAWTQGADVDETRSYVKRKCRLDPWSFWTGKLGLLKSAGSNLHFVSIIHHQQPNNRFF